MPRASTNPFLEGCTEPFGVPKRVLLSACAGVVVAFLVFAFEQSVVKARELDALIVSGVAAAIAAGVAFFAVGGVRDQCRMRDTYEFYAGQGAPPDVAKALAMQLSRSESTYIGVMLIWIYTCARLGGRTCA